MLRAGSVGGAAALLSLSQPAVTKLLRALEEETGLSLFDRSRRRLSPTIEARRFAEEVEQLFAAADRVEAAARDLGAAGTGRLRIACLPLLGARMMPRLLARFATRPQPPALSLVVESSAQVAALVQGGGADLGFVLPLPGGVAHEAAAPFRVPAVLVLPPGHRLAGRAEVAPRELEGEACIALGRDYRLRHLVDELFDRHGVTRRLAAETQNAQAACAMAAAGLGFAVTDPVTAAGFGAEVAVARLAPTATFHLHVLAPPGRPLGALAQAFLWLATEEFSRFGIRPVGGMRRRREAIA